MNRFFTRYLTPIAVLTLYVWNVLDMYDNKTVTRSDPNAQRKMVKFGSTRVQLTKTLVGYVSRYQIGPTTESMKLAAVTQLSWNKIETLRSLSTTWNGPISCSILYTDHVEGMDEKVEDFIQTWPERSQPIYLHMVVGKQVGGYPINIMRNMALQYAPTQEVVYLDSDFVPSKDAWETILYWLEEQGWKYRLANKIALVLPAFERILEDDKIITPEMLPRTKSELIQELPNEKIFPFHLDYFPRGHRKTDFDRWYKATNPYEAVWEPRFEPYVVVNRHFLPPFWNGFYGFGFNKLAWIMELHYAGYHFDVLPDVFLVHINHSGRENRAPLKAMKTEYSEKFLPYLKIKYGRKFIWDIECPMEMCLTDDKLKN